MKKLLLLVVLLLVVTISNAARLISGSLNPLKGEKYILVTLDCSKLMYKKNRPFDDFLAKAPRSEDWELESVKSFPSSFNEETCKVKLSAISESSKYKDQAKYEIKIVPFNIDGGGDLDSQVIIVNISTRENVATLEFHAEGDDDITLRDPLKESGEDLGKLFRNALKK